VLHRRPWTARSIAEFWGSRWNLWVSDWFRHVIFRPLRHRPVLTLILAFAISGLLHEWVINVPLFCVTGRALFGSMMLYFLIQAAGILLERLLFRKHARMMVLFTWLVVFVPCPLILNEGMHRVLHLWPGGK
jgi:D-alanyl-lipoteichoic acid acyltransferase DltB (MBOAT superfamily)